MSEQIDGREAREAFVKRVYKRMMYGAPADAVKGTYDLSASDWAWAWGYEQALADLDATKAVFEKAFAPSAMGNAEPVRPCWVDSCQKPYAHDGECDRTRL